MGETKCEKKNHLKKETLALLIPVEIYSINTVYQCDLDPTWDESYSKDELFYE